ncbi:MAG: cytochrome c biogenesis protein CcsA [Deltaproteobacteria bacterium]|nr:cytochrome c biogenesis protein CcsA [Deltaproteobacteria bacterium]
MKHAALTLVTIIAGLLVLAALCLVFLCSPVDANMGIVQKIFYFHVSSAYTMYLSWGVVTVCSIVFLARRSERADMLARSAAELTLVFTVIVLVTGPLWGRKSWGAYWSWDPRLTSTLLFATIVASYALLRGLSSGEAERRFAAALSILGACVAPIIHISVQKWRGQHPTVITGKGGGLAPEMWPPFIVSLAAFTLLFAALLWHRYRLEENRRRIADLAERIAARGLGEEDAP